jgi:hypothetical protein
MKRIFHTYPPKWELDEADDFTANLTELIDEIHGFQFNLSSWKEFESVDGRDAFLAVVSAGVSLTLTQL